MATVDKTEKTLKCKTCGDQIPAKMCAHEKVHFEILKAVE